MKDVRATPRLCFIPSMRVVTHGPVVSLMDLAKPPRLFMPVAPCGNFSRRTLYLPASYLIPDRHAAKFAKRFLLNYLAFSASWRFIISGRGGCGGVWGR